MPISNARHQALATKSGEGAEVRGGWLPSPAWGVNMTVAYRLSRVSGRYFVSFYSKLYDSENASELYNREAIRAFSRREKGGPAKLVEESHRSTI